MDPLISIIITSYNRKQYISKAIESVLQQDYQNLEVIIIDNCSTDNSEEMINKYVNDSRVRFIKNEVNIGAVPSIIKAVGLARGVYFTHVSSDDHLIYKSFISEGVELIRRHANIILLTGKNIFYNQTTNQYRPPRSYKNDKFFPREVVDGKEVFLEYLRSYPITMGACLMNREKFINLQNDINAPIYYDLQVIMQLLLLGNVAFIDKEVYLVNLHDKNLSSVLQLASVNIDNYIFIEAPYRLAYNLGSFDTRTLNKWYHRMLFNYTFYMMSDYYKKDKKQFAIFRNHVRSNLPTIYEKICMTPKWVLLKILFAFPSLGSNLVKFKNFVKSLKFSTSH